MCKEVVLSTEKLTKKYGNITTVNSVDLHVKKGQKNEIDTLDTLYDIATEEVMKEHLIQTGKPCKSINDCFGGYMRGRDRLIELVSNEIHKLDRLPIAVFILFVILPSLLFTFTNASL